ncbi:hypothetical protein PPS11_36955 [Pseudomonas putida S11]|nr:hypothetical protein PPS11_36955 [Pseudomonas putida S11]
MATEVWVQAPGVDHDAGAAATGGMDPVDQFAFVVGLAEFDFQAEGMGGVGHNPGPGRRGFRGRTGQARGCPSMFRLGPLSNENKGLHDGHRFVVVGCFLVLYRLVSLVNWTKPLYPESGRLSNPQQLRLDYKIVIFPPPPR